MADVSYSVSVEVADSIRNLNRLQDQVGSLSKSVGGIQSSLNGFKSGLIDLAGAVAGVSLFRLVDDIQNMQNRIRVATQGGVSLAESLAAVKAIADKTGQSMVSIGDLYAKVAANSNKLGYSQEQTVALTDAFATALRVSGASAAGASSAIYQFTQILNKGKVNGDEFTTIMENLGGPVMETVASKLGITTAQMLKLKEEGKLTASMFSDALIRSLADFNKMGDVAGTTVGVAFVKIQNSFANFLINLEKSTGIFATVAKAMELVAENARLIGIFIAAAGGYWAASKIFAWGAMAIQAAAGIRTLVIAIRSLGIAAAVSEALATGGLSAITAAAGAAAAAVAATIAFDKIDSDAAKLNVDLKAISSTATNDLKPALDLSGPTDAFRKFSIQVANTSFEFKKRNSDFRDSLELEGRMIGSAKVYQDAEKKRMEVIKDSQDRIRALQQQRAALTSVEQTEGRGAVIDAEIKKIEQLRNAEMKASTASIFAFKEQELLQKTLVAGRERLIDVNKQIADMDFAAANAGMSALDVQLKTLTKSANDWANSTIASFASAENLSVDAFKQMYPDKVRQVYDAARQGVDKLAEAARKANAEAMRVKDLQTYMSRALETTIQLSQLELETTTMNMDAMSKKMATLDSESAYYLARRIRQYDIERFGIDKVIEGYSIASKEAGKGGDPKLLSQMSKEAQVNLDKLREATQFHYELSRTWYTGWRTAFNEYVDAAENAAKKTEAMFKKAVQGMEDVLVDFVKTGKFEWKGFVNSMLEELLRSQIRSAFAGILKGVDTNINIARAAGASGGGGGILSWLGDTFGGFFANGGTLGAGKFGIAGENGPELISGPATITPMSGVTNVTYNINAVDAPSFKALIASDPGFIHAVASAGARSVPGRR